VEKNISRRSLLIASASVPLALSARAALSGNAAAGAANSSTNPAYWLGRSTFRDKALIERYIKENAVFAHYPKGNYSYELLSRDGKVVHLEGGSRYEHYYLWKFPSMAVAMERYNNAKYQEVANLRRAGSSANELVVFEGGDHFTGKY
jgi:uncharacterized protein (DUF1330 family)